MTHDMFMQKGIIFFEGLVKVNRKHCSGTWFYLKIGKILQSVPLSKVRTKPRKKFLKV